MYKATLLLPDELVEIRGSARRSIRRKIPISEQGIVLALVTNDYHDNWVFPEGSVQVLSLEKLEEDEDSQE